MNKKARYLTGGNLVSWQLLEKFIVDWANKRQLIQGTKQQAVMQAAYMVTKLNELLYAITLYEKGSNVRNSSIKDAIGDTFLTIINTFSNLELSCLLVDQLKDLDEVDPYFQMEDILREVANEDQGTNLTATIIFTYSALIFEHILKQKEGYLDGYINNASELLVLLSYIAESIDTTLYSCVVSRYEVIAKQYK